MVDLTRQPFLALKFSFHFPSQTVDSKSFLRRPWTGDGGGGVERGRRCPDVSGIRDELGIPARARRERPERTVSPSPIFLTRLLSPFFACLSKLSSAVCLMMCHNKDSKCGHSSQSTASTHHGIGRLMQIRSSSDTPRGRRRPALESELPVAQEFHFSLFTLTNIA